MPYKVEHTLINHACASSETLERVFRRILYTNGGRGGGGALCQAFLAETVEIGTKPGSLRDRGHGCFAKKA